MHHIIRLDIVEFLWNKKWAQVFLYVHGCMSISITEEEPEEIRSPTLWTWNESNYKERCYTSVHLKVSYIFLWSIGVEAYPAGLQMSNSEAQNRKPAVLHSFQNNKEAPPDNGASHITSRQ